MKLFKKYLILCFSTSILPILFIIFSMPEVSSSYRKSWSVILLLCLAATTLILIISFLSGRSFHRRFNKILRSVEDPTSLEKLDPFEDDGNDELSELVFKLNELFRMLLKRRHENEIVIRSLRKSNEHLIESNQRFQLAVDGANDAIWDWDIQSDQLYISQRWNEFLGLKDSNKMNTMQAWLEAILPQDRDGVRQGLRDHLNGETPLFSAEYRIINRITGLKWILTRGLAFRNDQGIDIRMAGSHTDITNGRRLQERLLYNASHDDLTNLPNRMKLRERIQDVLLRAERDKEFSFTLLYLDFDGFKHINDSFGHNTGDMLLKSIAERLTFCIRPLDLVSRIGGDEFVILLDGIGDEDHIRKILERINSQISKPFLIDGRTIFISTSIGVNTLDRNFPKQPDELIQRADIAMYHAKNRGKARTVFYESSMGSCEKRRFLLENDMHKALGSQAMHIHYQPVVAAGTGTLYGMEALLRWDHQDHGMISPGEFIPIAEETGFINRITQWLLLEVCRQACLLNKNAILPIRCAINVSSKDFHCSGGLDILIGKAMKQTGCYPEWIAIEVTEGVLIKDFELVSLQLKRIDEMGIIIELDDFGTGYSSLSYLNKFPLKILKVDRSFIMTIEESSSSLKLVQTIIHMAKDLGMKTIAEGVETEGQLKALAELGCDYIQGYYISRPLDRETLPGFLARFNRYDADAFHSYV